MAELRAALSSLNLCTTTLVADRRMNWLHVPFLCREAPVGRTLRGVPDGRGCSNLTCNVDLSLPLVLSPYW